MAIVFDNLYFLFESEANVASSQPSVSADASVTPNATLNYTVSNFGGSITTATLTDSKGNVLTLTSVTDTSAVVPALADEQQYCILETVTLTVGDGTDTATDTVSFEPESGSQEVQLTSGFSTDEHSFLFNYGGTPAVDDQFIESSADLVLFSDGTFDADTSGHYTIFAIDATDGWMQSFVLDVVDVGGEASHQATTATHSAVGIVADVVGQGNHQASTATHTATGSIVTITGSGSHQAATATHTASGARGLDGTASHQAGTATHTATGERSGSVTGTSAHQAQPARQSATGIREITGAVSHTAQTATHSATGLRTITGSVSHQAETATHTASGTRTVTGSAAHQAETATQDASTVSVGSASHQAETATHTATGVRVVTGVSSHQAQRATHTGAIKRTIKGTASHQAATATHAAFKLVALDTPIKKTKIKDVSTTYSIKAA